jgi:hypothetical protein
MIDYEIGSGQLSLAIVKQIMEEQLSIKLSALQSA